MDLEYYKNKYIKYKKKYLELKYFGGGDKLIEAKLIEFINSLTRKHTSKTYTSKMYDKTKIENIQNSLKSFYDNNKEFFTSSEKIFYEKIDSLIFTLDIPKIMCIIYKFFTDNIKDNTNIKKIWNDFFPVKYQNYIDKDNYSLKCEK
jgi:hypothetical protein